jgi:hypothetical protein
MTMLSPFFASSTHCSAFFAASLAFILKTTYRKEQIACDKLSVCLPRDCFSCGR